MLVAAEVHLEPGLVGSRTEVKASFQKWSRPVLEHHQSDIQVGGPILVYKHHVEQVMLAGGGFLKES